MTTPIFGSGLLSNQEFERTHLVRGGGVSRELVDLANDVKSVLSPLAAMAVEEFTNPATASTNAIKTIIASSTSDVTYSGAALNGLVGGGTMTPPRNITITSTNSSDITGGNAIVTGTDVDGRVLTETIAITSHGNTTDAGLKAFATVTSVFIPAQGGTGGGFTIGFGVVIGLRKPLLSRAGLVAVIREVSAGTVVTNGVFVLPATSAPYGTYAPNSAPNGSNDYALYYEYDASLDADYKTGR